MSLKHIYFGKLTEVLLAYKCIIAAESLFGFNKFVYLNVFDFWSRL